MIAARLVTLSATELGDLEALLDAALRYSGIRVARDVAVLLFATDTPIAAGVFVFPPHAIAATHAVADAACRGRGFQLAEIAIAFVGRVMLSPEFRGDEVEGEGDEVADPGDSSATTQVEAPVPSEDDDR